MALTVNNVESAAQAFIYSPAGGAEEITYDGVQIYCQVAGTDVRLEQSVQSLDLAIQVQKSDVPYPEADKIVIFRGEAYRVTSDFYPVEGDWFLPLMRDFLEVSL